MINMVQIFFFCEIKSTHIFILLYFSVGNGYITTDVLKEILREIDGTLSEFNLDQIIEEVDEDESGTVDFDEFMAMMTGE